MELQTRHIEMNIWGDVPLLELKRTPLDGWGRIIKRIVDIVGSIIALILSSLFFLIVPIIIKFDSKGPVFFKQKRVGLDKNFNFLKFRTMKEGAQKEHNKLMKEHGIMFKLKNDPRITKVGKFLRKTSIDEIPQFINVLKGEMSLVGPRPPMPEEVAHYSNWQKKRLGVKPGITGLWQVSGRSNLSFEEWVKLDKFYIENWSFALDMQILFRTFIVLINKVGAY
jgi:exopolysaccharide biosynthesis polyprenyl glycosylphosphotransferase